MEEQERFSVIDGSAMRPLRVLLISDDYPGHFNFADGVLAAIKRLRPVECETRSVRGRLAYRMQAVRPLVFGGRLALRSALKLGFGISARDLPEVDLVLSGGGNTLAANVAAARLLGVPNIFCGSLRGSMQLRQFSLVVTSYEEQYDSRSHLATVKPSIYSPDLFHRPPRTLRFGAGNPPKRAGLLVGGDSGLIRWRREEWPMLIAFLRAVSAAWGTRWSISTSRRTPDAVADQFAELAADKAVVELFVDFRQTGQGTLLPIFEAAEIMVCTTDSSSMVSEAIAVHLPVVIVSPQATAFKPEEEEYRRMLTKKSWCRNVPLGQLDLASFGTALGEISVPRENHLDLLAENLRKRLPALFGE